MSNTHQLKVGDRIVVRRDNRAPMVLTVRDIDAPGTYGIAMSAGPVVHAWVRPGGWGVTFDDTTTWMTWEKLEDVATVHPRKLEDGQYVEPAEPAEAEMWSVYRVDSDGTEEWVADLGTREQAELIQTGIATGSVIVTDILGRD